jgi:hypothetical protein
MDGLCVGFPDADGCIRKAERMKLRQIPSVAAFVGFFYWFGALNYCIGKDG